MENHAHRIQWYHLEPFKVTLRKVLGPQFGKTVYIFEVNGARKIKYHAHVAMNKNSDPAQKFFLSGGWRGHCPNSKFPNFWNCPKRVELANSYSGCRLI